LTAAAIYSIYAYPSHFTTNCHLFTITGSGKYFACIRAVVEHFLSQHVLRLKSHTFSPIRRVIGFLHSVFLQYLIMTFNKYLQPDLRFAPAAEKSR